MTTVNTRIPVDLQRTTIVRMPGILSRTSKAGAWWRMIGRPLGLAGFLMLASGCGFQPLMGGGNVEVRDKLESIRVEVIADRSGQILRNYLLDDLTPRGVRGSGSYRLQVRLFEPRREVAIRRDDTASRLGYTASVHFELQDSTGRRIFSGSSQSETTFEVTNSEFATLSGLTSARDRALQVVSADIRQQLADFFVREPARPAGR